MKIENLGEAGRVAATRQRLIDELACVQVTEFIDLKLTPKLGQPTAEAWKLWDRKLMDIGEADKRMSTLFNAIREVVELHLRAAIKELDARLVALGVEP